MTRSGMWFLVLMGVSGAAVAAPGARPPNIVHIIADDVGFDEVGAFGAKDIPTPNLDRLAAEGMKLTSFYAPHASCTPSRAAILTGSYAPRVGLGGVLFPDSVVGLAQNEITVAELLRGRGYSTALVGKWHLGHQPQFLPQRHGFDLFFGIPYPNDHGPERLRDGKRGIFPSIPLLRNDEVVEQPVQLGSLPERLVSEAIEFLDKNKGRPFYLHFANVETHTPWIVPARCQYKSKAGVYGDAVHCLDWAVGEIMDALRRFGLDTKTLVIFTSDNGPLVMRYPELEGIYGHAATVDPSRPRVLKLGKYQATYEGGTRVAAIARWPGKVPSGKTSDAVVAGFDLYSTFAKLAGAQVPKDRMVDGKDISSILFGEKNAKSPHEAFYYYEQQALVGVRSGGWKLILPRGLRKNGGVEAIETARLFDIDRDRGETTDLAAAHPDVVKRLQALAEKARVDLGDSLQKRAGKNLRPAGKAAELAN